MMNPSDYGGLVPLGAQTMRSEASLHSSDGEDDAGRHTTITFLFTDIEGSTALYKRHGEKFRALLKKHHVIMRAEFTAHGGQEVSEAGDGFVVAFHSPRDALGCAIAAQRALDQHAWPESMGKLNVRMALHSGEAEVHDDDYRGFALHHGARILGATRGGQILCSETTASLLQTELSAGADFKDLGVYRLRDIPDPARLLQVNYHGMAKAEFPAPTAAPLHVHSLPSTLTKFFGREMEIARLSGMLLAGVDHNGVKSEDRLRLITLTGPGGTGKTRLALAVAERLVSAFSHAVWFIPLADLADERLMGDAIRDVLRLPVEPSGSSLEQVAKMVSSQPSLLLLDNFEQLADKGATIVRALLDQAPSLVCLITSRQRLNLSGEREFSVPPLPTPSLADTPDQLLQYESVQLFLDRARSVHSEFRLTKENTADIAELCQKLEGVPLALELAAARAQILTPRQMVERLTRRFDFLVGGKKDAAARHRTLRAAIDGSYELLSKPLQNFFGRLSVFRGGWALEAAEAVCETPQSALDDLAELRGCSLILAEESHGQMRYRMLETLRQYAEEHLAQSADGGIAHRLHRDFFLTLAEQAEPELHLPNQAQWLDRLETEHDNIRAALAWTSEDAVRLRFATLLHHFWMVRGHVTEGLDWLEKALSAATTASNDARAEAHNAAGILAWVKGSLGAARDYFGRGLDQFHNTGDVKSAAGALNNLGIVASHQGDFDAARNYYEDSLRIYRKLNVPSHIGTVLSNLGFVAIRQGDFSAAQVFLAESEAIQRQLKDRFCLANTLQNVADVFCHTSQLERAGVALHESLVIRRALGANSDIADACWTLALIKAKEMNFEAAARLLGAAEASRERSNSPLAPAEHTRYEFDVAAISRSMLSSAFVNARSAGRSLPLDEIINLAQGWKKVDQPNENSPNIG